MKLNKLSAYRIFLLTGTGALAAAILVAAVFYIYTENPAVLVSGGIFTAIFFIWGIVYHYLFQKRLSEFTDEICKDLDLMMNGQNPKNNELEEETQLSKIRQKLLRLYRNMKISGNNTKMEKKVLQELVSDISHQTRTPVSNLRIIIDTLIYKDIPSIQKKEFLMAADGQIMKLEFLMEALVKTSCLETGAITLKKESGRLYDTLLTAINGVLLKLESRKLEFSMNCPENLVLKHDKKWTAEAFFNLLDNAVKYTSFGGSVKINVLIGEMYVRIDFCDKGRGIPEHEQASIFKRFYREEAVRETEGIGIGLYLTREIITFQGGYIKVLSNEGEGSVFSVYLPL